MYTGAFQNVTPEQVLPLGGASCSYLPFPLLHGTKLGRKEIIREFLEMDFTFLFGKKKLPTDFVFI